MISQSHRFHGHGSLRYVYKKGSSVRSSLLTIKYVSNSRRRATRCSVVVSKKVLKSAVGRNRIRRRIYETMRPILPQTAKPYDIVVIVWSADVRTLPYPELATQLSELLCGAQIIDSRAR
jgi:ribonuclease P protein component